MGYRKTTRRIQVSLKDHPAYSNEEEPPEAVARGRNLNEYLVLVGLREPEEGDDRSVTVRQLEEFSESLISWNLETEDGTPLPCNSETFFSIDNDLAIVLATEWVEILGGKTDAPLQESSPAGEPSPAALALPMEPLSTPQQPSSMPA